MLSLLPVQGSGPPDGLGGWLQRHSGCSATACSGEPKGGMSCRCVVLVRAGSASFSLCKLHMTVSC